MNEPEYFLLKLLDEHVSSKAIRGHREPQHLISTIVRWGEKKLLNTEE